MESLEASVTRMQEDAAANREDVEAIRDSIKELERGQERADFYGQKMDSMFSMLAVLPQFKVARELHPRLGTEPILEKEGILPRPDGIRMLDEQGVYEHESQGRNIGHSHPPVPRLEIPIFEGEKSRWWVR